MGQPPLCMDNLRTWGQLKLKLYIWGRETDFCHIIALFVVPVVRQV